MQVLEINFGDSMLTSISTGNAIATALVIAMFIYLFVKLNIKFIVRQFTIIIFTIFTPVAAGLWIINKNVTAASIWAGQILMNIFMQFIYCFLFLIYLAFLPSRRWLGCIFNMGYDDSTFSRCTSKLFPKLNFKNCRS